MDLATIVGIIMGTLLIGVVTIEGGSPGMFVSVPGLAIVLGGVTAGVLIRYRADEVTNVFALIKKCFVNDRHDINNVIGQLVDMANLSRKEGILALERVKSDNPFLQSAINHCVDGAAPDFLETILSKEMEYMAERHEKGIEMLEVMGDMAPAFGMLATLIGLMHVLVNMDNPAALGPAVAMTLLGTFYGVVFANLFMFPLAAKLVLYHDDEARIRQVIKDGILGIQRGVNPRMLQVALRAALPPSKRKK